MGSKLGSFIGMVHGSHSIGSSLCYPVTIPPNADVSDLDEIEHFSAVSSTSRQFISVNWEKRYFKGLVFATLICFSFHLWICIINHILPLLTSSRFYQISWKNSSASDCFSSLSIVTAYAWAEFSSGHHTAFSNAVLRSLCWGVTEGLFHVNVIIPSLQTE
jgi:hypothetical protein